MSFLSYSHYKYGGEKWLGEVPEHWNIMPMWKLFRRMKRVGHESEQLLSVYREHGVVPKASRNDNNNKASDDLSSYQLVRQGDLVINKMKAWQGSVAISDHQGIVSPAYFVYESINEEESRYLHYLMRSLRYVTGYFSMSKGIRVNQWDLEPQYHSRIPVLIPPKDEQKAIVRLLDRETVKIDVLISEQEKLIKLLAEKRQATISRAVTKGLNPAAAMKDSGVDWLGEVPEHWEIGPIKKWFSTSSGGTPDTGKHDIYYTDEGGFPWIRTTDLNNDVLDAFEISITEEAIKSTACKTLPAGSVLLAMYGGDGTIGKNALLSFDACINQAVCALIPNQDFLSEFTFRYVQFYRPYWMIGAESSRKDPNIGQSLIQNTKILRPPVDEQMQIVSFLRTEIGRLNALSAEARHGIELLNERRSALISAAVTGKIDVRQAAQQQQITIQEAA